MSADAGTWVGAIALAIPLAAAAAMAPRGLWLLDQRRRHENSEEQARAADRAAMLSRVRDKWIDGILTPSMSHTERLALGVIRNGRDDAQTPILQLFLRTGGGLLILGRPGGGKTTLLLELADGLLERAESDPSQPVPVVASLASWASKRQPLTDWLTAELAERYRIPAAAARDWACQEDLALLLDGLDEVPDRHRDACAAAINRFLDDRPLTRMAVCCRADVARRLSVPLNLMQTLELRPAARPQVDAYLARLETTWTPLAELRSALAADERLRVPLLLKAAALANRGRTPPARGKDDSDTQQSRLSRRLRVPDWPPEIAEIFAPRPPWHATGTRGAIIDEATIWAAYIARMLGPRVLAPASDYDEAAARHHLGWLAARLRDGDDPQFQLDRVGLAAAGQETHRPAHHTAATADQRLQASMLDLAGWLDARPAVPGAAKTASWLRDHAAAAHPGAWLARLPQALTQPAEETGWSPGRRPPLRAPLTAALLLPAIIALATAVAGPALALPGAVLAGLLFGLGLPRRLGRVPRPRRPRTVPGESVRRSARQATAAGLATAAASCLGLLLTSLVVAGVSVPLAIAAAVLAGLAASTGTGGGAYVRHYAERARLVRAGALPWRARGFLDAMTERSLLYRSGTGYQFIHPMLRDHMAPPASPALADTEVRPVPLSHEPAYRADQPSPERVPHRAQHPAGRDSAGTG
jgi:hypothetical protein